METRLYDELAIATGKGKNDIHQMIIEIAGKH